MDDHIDFEEGVLYRLKITDLTPDPDQPRKFRDEDKMLELITTIEEFGILCPIVFTVRGGNRIIVSGERRWRAAHSLGHEKIDALYRACDCLEVSIIENECREDFSVMELAQGLARLKHEKGCTNREIALKLGKSDQSIGGLIALTRLPDYIKEKCLRNKQYPQRELLRLTYIEDEAELRAAFEILEARYAASQKRTIKAKQKTIEQCDKVNRLCRNLSRNVNQLSDLPETLAHNEKEYVRVVLGRMEEAINRFRLRYDVS